MAARRGAGKKTTAALVTLETAAVAAAEAVRRGGDSQTGVRSNGCREGKQVFTPPEFPDFDGWCNVRRPVWPTEAVVVQVVSERRVHRLQQR